MSKKSKLYYEKNGRTTSEYLLAVFFLTEPE
jgi:hypothetical protein